MVEFFDVGFYVFGCVGYICSGGGILLFGVMFLEVSLCVLLEGNGGEIEIWVWSFWEIIGD